MEEYLDQEDQEHLKNLFSEVNRKVVPPKEELEDDYDDDYFNDYDYDDPYCCSC